MEGTCPYLNSSIKFCIKDWIKSRTSNNQNKIVVAWILNLAWTRWANKIINCNIKNLLPVSHILSRRIRWIRYMKTSSQEFRKRSRRRAQRMIPKWSKMLTLITKIVGNRHLRILRNSQLIIKSKKNDNRFIFKVIHYKKLLMMSIWIELTFMKFSSSS